MKNILFLIPIVLVTMFLSSYDKDRGVRHDEKSILTWKDFKGKVNKRSSYFASTSSGYKYNAAFVGDSLRIVLPCMFYPGKSWVKKGKETPSLLKHEQGHFDLTEIYTRKMRQEIASKKYHVKKVNIAITKVIKKYSKQLSLAQGKYDTQTNHSIIEKQQEKWNEKIRLDLKSTEMYANPIFMVMVKM